MFVIPACPLLDGEFKCNFNPKFLGLRILI
uniref:Uncharacterized protein n=1 Tax=Anguilla anguilla TaxID=7936 RepID=A0A0E9V664_ANGAN